MKYSFQLHSGLRLCNLLNGKQRKNTTWYNMSSLLVLHSTKISCSPYMQHFPIPRYVQGYHGQSLLCKNPDLPWSTLILAFPDLSPHDKHLQPAVR